jgi:sulfatase modifying factor 1
MRRIAVAVAIAACGRYGFGTQGGDARAIDAPPPPSCVALAETCGPAGATPCCDNIYMTGGTFYRSYDVGTDGMYPSMGFPATVSDFRLDTYEVTVGRFRQFVTAGMGTQLGPPSASSGAHPAIPNSGWSSAWDALLVPDTPSLLVGIKCNASFQTWTDAPGANEELPINCVNWYEAFAFCIWDGGYLPTEAEWNYAASGGTEQRAYPWSTPPSDVAIDCAHANYTGSSCGANLDRVGAHSPAGDGKWGHADLAGNVWEKTLDWYQSTYPTQSCNDCSNVVQGSAGFRSVRGGAYNGNASSTRTANRYYDPPTDRYIEMGMRCARPM